MAISSIHCLQIASLFANQAEKSLLKVEKKDKSYHFSVANFDNHSERSLNNFKELIGEKRFKRICEQSDLRIDTNSLVLTKSIVRKFFLGLMNIKKEDLDELEGSIESRYKKLTLFNDFNEFERSLLENLLKLEHFQIDKVATSGKGLKGLVERIYILMHHHFKVLEEKNDYAKQIRDAEMLTSRLADREMQKGTVIHLRDGYFYVDELFVGGGSYVSILKDIENVKPPKIVCRGTAMRCAATDNWKTGLNDIQLEIGTMGVKSIGPKLAYYLKDQKVQSVEVLGKSLGGAQAQELAILIEGIAGIPVEKLTTYCSVGAGTEINELFKKEILGKRRSPFHIHLIRNDGDSKHELDAVPEVGGVHLGEGSARETCNIEITYIWPADPERKEHSPKISIFRRILRFIRTLKTTHCRQTTLRDFKWIKIVDQNEINKHLSMGTQLERIRKVFAYLIHFLTLFYLNGRSFDSFYKSQKEFFNPDFSQNLG